MPRELRSCVRGARVVATVLASIAGLVLCLAGLAVLAIAAWASPFTPAAAAGLQPSAPPVTDPASAPGATVH